MCEQKLKANVTALDKLPIHAKLSLETVSSLSEEKDLDFSLVATDYEELHPLQPFLDPDLVVPEDLPQRYIAKVCSSLDNLFKTSSPVCLTHKLQAFKELEIFSDRLANST